MGSLVGDGQDGSSGERGGGEPARRSIFAFACIALGFVLARHCAPLPSAGWFGGAAVVLMGAALLRGRWAKGALVAAAVLFGAGWFTLRIHEAPAAALRERIAAEAGRGGAGQGRHGPVLLTVEGMVVDRVEAEPAERAGAFAAFVPRGGPPAVRTWVDVDRLHTSAGEAVSVTARMRVRLAGVTPGEGREALPVGGRVRLTGEFTAVEPALNPGAPDRLMLAAQHGGGGLAGSLRVPGPELVAPLPLTPGVADRLSSVWVRAIVSLRSGAAGALERTMDGGSTPRAREALAVLRALLLGEYDASAEEIASAFTRQGIVHLLAISGFHLVVIAWAAGWLVRLTGERGGVEPAAVAALVGAYMLIVPAHAPVMRAGIMVLSLLAAEALGRRYDRITVLGWVATGLVLWRPMDLWSLGFQLSMGVVAVLLWLGTPWQNRMFPPPLRGTIRTPPPAGLAVPFALARWCIGQGKGLLAAGVLCWAVSAPVIAHHTGIVSPLAAVTGAVLVPLVAALLLLGYAALLVGALAPETAPHVGAVLELLAGGITAGVRVLDDVPLTVWRLPAVSALWAAVAVGVLLYFFSRGRLRDGRAWLLGAVAAAWLVVEVVVGPALAFRGVFRVDMLAVSDGSCLLVRGGRSTDGEDALLWDCGSQTLTLGLREIPRAARALGAGNVRTVVVTHGDLDHYSALLDTAGPLGVRRVLVPPALLAAAEARDGGPVRGLLDGLRDRGVEVRTVAQGDVMRLGSARVEFLWPPAWLVATERGRGIPSNDTSLVALVRIPVESGERRVLLTGDIGPAPMGAILRDHPELSADVLELPHHGSAHESALHFAATVGPSVVLQSTGPRRVNDPRWEPLRRSRVWYTTAVDGAAWVEVRGDGEVRTEARVRGR